MGNQLKQLLKHNEGVHISGGDTVPMKKQVKGKTTFEMGGGWGDRIEIFNWSETPNKKHLPRITGWKNPLPKNGDLLKVQMKSGKTGIFEIVNIKYCDNPSDMFFADIKLLKYEGE